MACNESSQYFKKHKKKDHLLHLNKLCATVLAINNTRTGIRTDMLKYQDEKGDGSFYAAGTGLKYRYDGRKNALHISVGGSCNGLYTLFCPKRIQKNPQDFIYFLERASSIKALILSNNKTTDLTKTLNEERLKPILQSVFDIAIQSYDLHQENFDTFTDRLVAQYDLEDLQIKYMHSTRSGTSYYRLFIKTKSGHDAVIREKQIDHLIRSSARTISGDLIPLVLTGKKNTEGEKVLHLSTILGILGRILNKDFKPEIQMN